MRRPPESFEARCAGVARTPHRHTLLQKILVRRSRTTDGGIAPTVSIALASSGLQNKLMV